MRYLRVFHSVSIGVHPPVMYNSINTVHYNKNILSGVIIIYVYCTRHSPSRPPPGGGVYRLKLECRSYTNYDNNQVLKF